MSATADSAFFYQLIKPGRYLGGEAGLPVVKDRPGARRVLWVYPERYERAITDESYRRAYFQLAACPDLRLGRVVEYAADVWPALQSRGLPAFALEEFKDVREADVVLFWLPDPVSAAHIPSLIRKLGLAEGGPAIGVITAGPWCPRFLLGHVDWVLAAPGGRVPASILEIVADPSGVPSGGWPVRHQDRDTAHWPSWSAGLLLPTNPAHTPRWVPRVEVEDEYADVDMECVDVQGRLRARDLDTLVVDSLDALRTTGLDGLRFCGGDSSSQRCVEVLQELQRRHNMKRVRAHWPASTPPEFDTYWSAYKPHLLKPILRLRVDDTANASLLGDIGRRALNSGWHGLTAVIEFTSFEVLSRSLNTMREVLALWSKAAESHADRRPLRVEYAPAPLNWWADPASVPDDDAMRRYAGELRHFKDDMSRLAAVGTFRIEEIMARNWLSAAETDLWPRLAELDLSDPNDPEMPDFDWFAWVRQLSGLTAPPSIPYLRSEVPVAEEPAPPESRQEAIPTLLTTPADHLFGRRKRRMGYTRRLVSPPMTRMRVRWAKDMPWRLYSHLDSVRAIERAVRRSGLPAAYSEGFHPRLKLSFGPPLALGLLSDAEYFDLMLEEDVEASDIERLSQALPNGIRLVEAKGIPAGIPALTDTINEAVFAAVLPIPLDEAQARLEAFQSQPTVRWARTGRDDRKPVDPRKTLRQTSVESTPEGTRWTLTVILGSDGSIRPTDWAMLLFGFTTDDIAHLIIRRTALLIRRAGITRSPLDPV